MLPKCAGRASQPPPRYGCQPGASIGRDLFDSVAVLTGLMPIVRKIRHRLAAGTTHQDEPIMTHRGVIRRMIFYKSRLHAGLQMTTGERSFKEKLVTELTDPSPTDDSTKSSTLPKLDVNIAFPK